MPFITFLFGLLAIPYIERRKEDVKGKAVLKNFRLEIEDETKNLRRNINKMAESLSNLNKIKNDNDDLSGILKYIPRETSCYFLKDALENSFKLLSSKQRLILKSMKVQIEAINLNSERLKSIDDDLLDERINECKRYIFTACSLDYSMIVLLESSSTSSDIASDNDIVRDRLEKLKIGINVSDLKIKKTHTYKSNW